MRVTRHDKNPPHILHIELDATREQWEHLAVAGLTVAPPVVRFVFAAAPAPPDKETRDPGLHEDDDAFRAARDAVYPESAARQRVTEAKALIAAVLDDAEPEQVSDA